MKKILLGLIIVSGFLPQLSFADALTDFTQKQDADSRDFANEQAQERSEFIKANPVLIAKQDKQGQWLMAHKTDPNDPSPKPPDLTSAEENIYATFVGRQREECRIFAQSQAQEKKNFLGR